MTIFLTILAGVATFALGQVFLRIFVEPVHELKRTIAEIAVALIKYANVYSNPGVTTKERENEAARELRALASKLNAQMYLVPWYSALRRVFGLPPRSNASQAMRHLIGISNAVHQTNADMGTANAEKSDKVCDLLGIHMPEEDLTKHRASAGEKKRRPALTWLGGALLSVLTALLVWFGSAIVRLENENYALRLNMCPWTAGGPITVPERNECLATVETRTSRLWHLYYALAAEP